MQNDNRRIMPFCHIGSIKESVRRVLAKIGSIKDFLDLRNHLSPPFYAITSGKCRPGSGKVISVGIKRERLKQARLTLTIQEREAKR
jgi:hypothetical protein